MEGDLANIVGVFADAQLACNGQRISIPDMTQDRCHPWRFSHFAHQSMLPGWALPLTGRRYIHMVIAGK